MGTVNVSGDVKWGDRYYRVNTNGKILDWKKGAYALVLLDEVDGDRMVTINV